ncbi:hypothetical protein ANN_11832 [Periplaneta americana]|uniref:Uncharacterized protein n=1 Tax=Periplaneta americana TaxID=6978 RepID=A0ABQ8T6T1_PERAM|nr:hypothetical protein ANN_11832 [Periplaneta americana]
MEYGAVGWDPYRQNQIDSIENVQCKAAKYVKMGKGHSEEMVKDLGWELLKSRRRKTRLTALFKAQMGHKAWTDINARLATPSYLGRADHIRKVLAGLEDEYEEVRWDGIVSIVSWRERVFRLWWEEKTANPTIEQHTPTLTIDNCTSQAKIMVQMIASKRAVCRRRLRWAGHVARMGESRNAYRVLVGRPEGKRPLGRQRHRWEDNIKMDLREVGYDDRDWINLAQDRDRWRAYVRAAMNLRVPEKPFVCIYVYGTTGETNNNHKKLHMLLVQRRNNVQRRNDACADRRERERSN